MTPLARSYPDIVRDLLTVLTGGTAREIIDIGATVPESVPLRTPGCLCQCDTQPSFVTTMIVPCVQANAVDPDSLSLLVRWNRMGLPTCLYFGR